MRNMRRVNDKKEKWRREYVVEEKKRKCKKGRKYLEMERRENKGEKGDASECEEKMETEMCEVKEKAGNIIENERKINLTRKDAKQCHEINEMKKMETEKNETKKKKIIGEKEPIKKKKRREGRRKEVKIK